MRMLSWKAWHHALDQLWQTCLSVATRSRLILLGENVASIGTGQCHRRQETVLVCNDARTLDFAWRRLRLQGTVLEHISSRCLVSWTFPPLEIDRTITAKAHHAVMVAMPSADQLEEIGRYWLSVTGNLRVTALCYMQVPTMRGCIFQALA